MTQEFAAPPTPDGAPSGTVRRADFRPAAAPRRRRRMPRWAIALIALGGLVIVGGVATQVTLSARASHLTPADPDATGRLHSAQLVSGMCIELLPDGAGIVRVVSCAEPHSAEVATSIDLEGEEFPGADAVAAEVLDYCASQLAPGGPLAGEADGRTWVAWVPSEGTWAAGDRSGLCIVTAETPWTGS